MNNIGANTQTQQQITYKVDLSNLFQDLGKVANHPQFQFVKNYLESTNRNFYINLVVSPFISYYLQKFISEIGKPSLAQMTNKVTWFTWLRDLFFGKTEYEKKDPPIFDKELQKKADEIFEVAKQAKETGGYFENVILYGPGGTGKTMFAEMIATNSGMDYVVMSGGTLAQFTSRKEHVDEMNKLFASIKSSKNPTVLFIDEAESMLQKRDPKILENLQLVNAFLRETGTEDRKMMVILATNRLEDIDPDVLNRMTHKIHVKPPGLEQRIQIITRYVKQFFDIQEGQDSPFSEKKIEAMAKKTDGFTGRSLFQMVNAFHGRALLAKEKGLTDEAVNEIVKSFVEQEKEMQKTLNKRR